jgi:hypothetical protein
MLLHFSACQVASKTAEYQAGVLSRVITAYNAQTKLVGMATDSAADVVAAVRILGVPHSPCLTHIVSDRSFKLLSASEDACVWDYGQGGTTIVDCVETITCRLGGKVWMSLAKPEGSMWVYHSIRNNDRRLAR